MNNIYKKLSVILMFLSMVGCFNVSIIETFADNLWGNSFAPESDNSTCTINCSGGGFRHYIIASGYRVSLVNENGDQVNKSIDYWPETDNTKDGNYCEKGFNYLTENCSLRTQHTSTLTIHYYSTKKPKTTVKGNASTTQNLKIDDSNRWDEFVNARLNKLNDNYYPEIVYTTSGEECYNKSKNPITNGIFTRTTGACAGDQRYNNNYTKFTLQLMGEVVLRNEHTDDDYKVVGKFLYNAGFGRELVRNTSNITIDEYKKIVNKASKNKIYLIVEPVVALARGNQENVDAKNGDIYLGTPAELYQMGFYSSGNYGWSFTRFSYLTPIIYAYGTGNVAGVKLTSSLPTVSTDNVRPGKNISSLGAYLFEIGANFDGGDCASDVITSIDNGTFQEDIDSIITSYKDTDWLRNYEGYGFTLSTLKSYLEDSNNANCPKPNCDTTASRLFNRLSNNNVLNILKILINNYQEKFDGFNSNTGIKKESDNQYITNFESKKIFGVTSNNDLCNPISCDTILSKLSKTEDNLNNLKDRFGDYDLLNSEILKALYQESENDNSWINKASCKGTPSCPVTPVTASCNGSNNFVLSDTADDTNSSKNDDEKCLKNGIAYNALKINNVSTVTQKNNTQTSYDSEYGTPNNPGYCWESVQFNFPTSVTNITASTLFKWSTNGNSYNKDDNLFGTMTVTRTCYPSDDFFTNQTSKKITSKWASVVGKSEGGRINPKITVNYEEAVPDNVSSDYDRLTAKEDLKVSLSSFKMGINGNFLKADTVEYKNDNEEYDTNEYIGNSDPRAYTCDNSESHNCKNVKYITMVATYNLKYGDAFKWYSNRSTDSGYLSEEDLGSSGVKDSYRYIGYGLPTSFVTPTNLAGTYDYGYDLSSNSGNGKLSVEVSQIGTLNRNGNGYHFDKMVKFAITDDNTSTNDDGKIYYSCGFDINNHIFGYEDDPCEEGTCDMPKGLDVVFRTIDLIDNSTDEEIKKAFPGMSGTGRTMGANWNEIYDIDDPNKGAENIFSILNSSIYSKEPMYHITLDVALIKEIRTLNDEVKGDPYSDKTEVTTDTAKAGQAGYYFGDLNEYGGGIRSLFLSYLYDKYNNSKFKTSCIKSNKDNGGNERNPDCFKAIVVD